MPDSSGLPTRPPGASFALPGLRIELPPVARFDLPQSGLILTQPCTPGRFYDVIGHRSALLGEEGGPFEVWTHPFKALAHCELRFEKNGRILKTAGLCREITVTPEATIFTYEGEGIRIRQIVFAPIERPSTVILFDVQAGAPLTIAMSFRSDLKLMWPADWQERSPEYGFDEPTGAWAVISSFEEHTVFAGAPGSAGKLGLTDGMPTVSVEVTEEDAGLLYPALLVASSLEGVDSARTEYAEVAGSIPDLFTKSVEYYANLLERTLSIETPDAALNEAYRWAKVGLDKCYIETPSVGAGYVAGWSRAGDGGRPGFGWYFGRDSAWESFAACQYGQLEKVRRNLDLLMEYQTFVGPNRGKIYHELSAAHDFCFDKGYAYVAGDSTPFSVIGMATYLRWTGDLKYVKERWGRIRFAMDWCYHMDVDKDLLIDNPPAGHQWYDYGEKNMVDLVAIWAVALDLAAWMGRQLNDSDAERWAADASKVRVILNSDFWDSARGYIYDRKLPDETFDGLTTANPAVPLLWGLILPEKAQRAISVLFGDDMAVPWGIRTNSSRDEIYKPWGYHEGTVWPLTTGWASLAAYRNHRPEEGFRALKANVALTNAFTPGYITEVLSGDERLPGGCPHQGWSEAMVISPLVEGMLGLDANVIEGTIRFAPHLPPDWDSVTIRNFRAGKDTFDIEYARDDHSIRVSLTHTSGSTPFRLELSVPIPSPSDVQSVTVNGGKLSQDAWEIVTTANDSHVNMVVDVGQGVEIKADF